MIDKNQEDMLNRIIGGLIVVRSAADSLFGCVSTFPPPLVGQVMAEIADMVEHIRKVGINTERLLQRHKDK